MKLSFRPHHFLCTLGFQGVGYSPYFVENYRQIIDSLQKNEEEIIHVTMRSDSICSACPHQGETGCAAEDKIQKLDARHAHILKLKQGDTLSWKEAKQRLKTYMTLENFHLACSSCAWKALGVCETALKKL